MNASGAARIRWGLLGASDIAETRLIPAMRRLGHDVVAVGSGTADWAATYADRNGIPVSGSVADVVARSEALGGAVVWLCPELVVAAEDVHEPIVRQHHVEHVVIAELEGTTPEAA